MAVMNQDAIFAALFEGHRNFIAAIFRIPVHAFEFEAGGLLFTARRGEEDAARFEAREVVGDVGNDGDRSGSRPSC